MSSLHSDPPFYRGQTLLQGETVEYNTPPDVAYANAVPTAGTEIVGQVKIFPDIHPVTKLKMSNELVYCMAVRYKPAASSDRFNIDGADRGKAIVLRNTATNSVDMQSTAEFDGTFATNANVNSGLRVGFVDEYLTQAVRANDIIWVVVKGPALVRKTTNAGINAGTLVTITGSAGRVVTASAVLTLNEATPNTLNQRAMGLATGSYSETTLLTSTGSNAASGDEYVRSRLYGINWGV